MSRPEQFVRPLASSTDIGPNDEFPFLDLTQVPWPEVEYYGDKHGQMTAKLAITIVSYIEDTELVQKDNAILWVAGLFHDVGRQNGWRTDDPGHSRHSAKIADIILKNDSEFWADEVLREGVGRLISQHDISRPVQEVIAHGPLAMALHDADSYESARIMPGTGAGYALLEKRTHWDRLCTQWAKNHAHRKAWMSFRGWKGLGV